MTYPYEHQADIKNLIGEGDFILFSDGGGINSGVVKTKSERMVEVEDVNGCGETMILSLSDITLYRDTAWDE